MPGQLVAWFWWWFRGGTPIQWKSPGIENAVYSRYAGKQVPGLEHGMTDKYATDLSPWLFCTFVAKGSPRKTCDLMDPQQRQF